MKSSRASWLPLVAAIVQSACPHGPRTDSLAPAPPHDLMCKFQDFNSGREGWLWVGRGVARLDYDAGPRIDRSVVIGTSTIFLVDHDSRSVARVGRTHSEFPLVLSAFFLKPTTFKRVAAAKGGDDDSAYEAIVDASVVGYTERASTITKVYTRNSSGVAGFHLDNCKPTLSGKPEWFEVDTGVVRPPYTITTLDLKQTRLGGWQL